MMYTIYALVDPRDYTIRYVGITNDVYRRFQEHLRADAYSDEKGAWIRGLKAAQMVVIMQTLEQVESIEEAQEREIFWIQHFLASGVPLLNAAFPDGQGKMFIGGSGRKNGVQDRIDMLTQVALGGSWPEHVTPAMQRYYKRTYPAFFGRKRKSIARKGQQLKSILEEEKN